MLLLPLMVAWNLAVLSAEPDAPAAAPVPVAVEALALDGTAVSGKILTLDDKQLVLEGTAGRVTLPVNSLAAIVRKGAATAPAAAARFQVELVDGSQLLAVEYLAKQGEAEISLTSGAKLSVPTAAIQWVRLGLAEGRDPKLTKQWSEITAAKAAADVIVIRKNESLDYLEGILGDVSAETCQFEVDKEVVPVKRTKIEGLIYFHPKQAEQAEPLGQVVLDDGSRLQAAKLGLEAGKIKLTTPAGVTQEVPLDAVTRFDFSAGKVAYLSDLDPERATFTPLVGLKEPPAGLEAFYQYRRDIGFEESPLRLDGKNYRKGLALASRTELVYRLPGKFRQFRAMVGIDDAVRETGNVHLEIKGDGRILWQGDVRGSEPARELELEITGVKRLEILADYGADQDIGDRLDLGEARVSK